MKCCDSDGYYCFVGRNDDLITSVGCRIGPSDIEDTTLSHSSVAEVAVVGKPDPERTEIVEAFVVLRAGWEAGDALAKQYQQLVRERLAVHAYPRKVAFLSELPKTPSGSTALYAAADGIDMSSMTRALSTKSAPGVMPWRVHQD